MRNNENEGVRKRKKRRIGAKVFSLFARSEATKIATRDVRPLKIRKVFKSALATRGKEEKKRMWEPLLRTGLSSGTAAGGVIRGNATGNITFEPSIFLYIFFSYLPVALRPARLLFVTLARRYALDATIKPRAARPS